MKMTLEQVKLDIKNKVCKRIYYSSTSLWWTHLESDVEEATKKGNQAQLKMLEERLTADGIPEDKKTLLAELLADVQKDHTPLDPTGAPLFIAVSKHDWIKQAEKKPSKFGRLGLDALMKAHHQNCNDQCFPKWQNYTNLLLIERQ
jgi:hypothetical protein